MADQTSPAASELPQRPDFVPVDRRVLGMDRATLLPAGIVAALVALMLWVLPAVNAKVSVEDRVEAGDIIQVGEVEFVPTAGWNITAGVRQDTEDPPVSYPEQATVTDGALALYVISSDFDGTPSQLLEQIEENNDHLSKDAALTVTGEPTTLENTAGDRGVIARFDASQAEGLIAAYVFDGVGAEVVVIGPKGMADDAKLAVEVANMIRSVRLVDGEQ
ncbi:hypothetical protein FXB39_11110 [Nocardioides sp. BGMRC 2183]|nr:hypothetical protein FXB39_11110 [Nocardioides sp. BGMRC 2183]